MSKHKEIREQRNAVYGDFRRGHKMLAANWTNILREHFQIDIPEIPTHIACLMLTELKILRAARPFKFDNDHYEDLRNYADFAHETAPAFFLEKALTESEVKRAPKR